MWRYFVLGIAILCLSAHAAGAQSSLEDKLRDQLRSVVTQLRTLQDQQAMLLAQKVAAEQERDALRKEVETLRARAGASQGDARARAALQASVAQYKSVAAQAAETVRAKEAERARIEATLAGRTALLEACMAKNGELYRVGVEILDAYRGYTLGDAARASEPVLGLYRVKLENLVQAYDDRLYNAQFDPRTVQMPAAPAAPSAGAAPAAPATAPPPSNPQPNAPATAPQSSQ
jgi:hypothetical protein